MNNDKKPKFLLFLIPPIILFAVTFIVMSLWNLLLPEIIGVKSITFWQAMGILILSKILFGGFHGRFGKGKFGNFKEKMMERKMSGMTYEEKEKFKEIWRKRCGTGFFKDEN